MSTSLGSTFSDGDLISIVELEDRESRFLFRNSVFTRLLPSQYPNLETSRSTRSFFLPLLFFFSFSFCFSFLSVFVVAFQTKTNLSFSSSSHKPSTAQIFVARTILLIRYVILSRQHEKRDVLCFFSSRRHFLSMSMRQLFKITRTSKKKLFLLHKDKNSFCSNLNRFWW